MASNLSIKDGDLHPIKRSRQQSKNQHYLTPPLTPSSSLRSDSTDPDSTDLSGPSDEQSTSPSQNFLSSDSAESRFLIVNLLLCHIRTKLIATIQIGNVPNDLAEDVIGPYFHSLAALPDDSSLARPNSQSVSNTGKVIQTIYYRFQEKRAIILAFYDIRDAERVKRLIEANGSHPHYGSDVDEKQKPSYEITVGSPWVEALTCLFVAPDHFLQVGPSRYSVSQRSQPPQLLGQSASAAMTHTEGVFCVSVGGMMAERDRNYSGWSRVRFFVPVKLKSELAKYGELKSFRLLKEDEEKCNQVCFTLKDVITCIRHSGSDTIVARLLFEPLPSHRQFLFYFSSRRFVSNHFVRSPAFRGRVLRHSCGGVSMEKSGRTGS